MKIAFLIIALSLHVWSQGKPGGGGDYGELIKFEAEVISQFNQHSSECLDRSQHKSVQNFVQMNDVLYREFIFKGVTSGIQPLKDLSCEGIEKQSKLSCLLKVEMKKNLQAFSNHKDATAYLISVHQVTFEQAEVIVHFLGMLSGIQD